MQDISTWSQLCAEAILNAIREPVMVLSKELRISFANKPFYDVFKLDPLVTLGKHLYELGDGEWDLPALKDLLGSVLQTQPPAEEIELRHTFKAAGEKELLLTARRVEVDGGDWLIVLAIHDISSRKRLEAEMMRERELEKLLRSSEENYRAIFDSANDAIFVHDLHTGQVISGNRKVEEMFGYRAEEFHDFFDEAFFSGVPGYTARDAMERFRRAAEGPPQLFEWLSRRKNGELFWVEVSLKAALIGDETRLLAIVRDITERKGTEEALKLTQFAVDHAAVAAFIIAQDGRILYGNEQACRGLGYSREELLSMTIPDIDPDFPHSRWPDHWEQLQAEGFLNFESSHRRKDGTLFPVEVSLNYLSFGGKEYNVGFTMDISERKRAESALRQAYYITESIIDSMKDPISLIDVRDFTIVKVNKVFVERYAYSDESEVVGKHCYKVTHHRSDVCSAPDDICPLIESVRTQDHFSAEHVHYDKAGEKVYVEVSTSPIKDEDGKVIQVVHIQRDITERKQVEETLRISESRFRNLFQQSALSLMIISPDGRVLEINHAFEDLWGLTLDNLKDYNILKDSQLMAKGVIPFIQKGFEGEAAEIPVIFYDPSEIDYGGRARWVKAFIYPIKGGSGRIHEVVLTHLDLTDMVEAELAIRESEEKFRTLADNIAQFAWMADVEGSIFWFNRRWYEFTGTTLEEMEGWGWKKVHHPDYADRVLKKFRDAIEAGTPWEDTFPMRGKDGHYRWFLSRAIPIRDEEGKILRWFGTNTDITERKRAEEELEGFTSSVSHDLRAPIRHMTSFAELLKMEAWPALNEESRMYLTTVINAARKTGVLVDELLQFSRTSRAELKEDAVDLKGLVDEVIQSLSSETKDRTVEWKIGSLPIVVGDASMLHLVLLNLLGNALKFTRHRPIAQISIESRHEVEECILSVRDNGVGFDMEHYDKLFKIFQRLHGSEEFEGTGIGLANVQRIIERHGGRVWAEGKVNEGAAFSIALPRKGKQRLQ